MEQEGKFIRRTADRIGTLALAESIVAGGSFFWGWVAESLFKGSGPVVAGLLFLATNVTFVYAVATAVGPSSNRAER